MAKLLRMGGKVERYFIPVVIGFAPFILFLLTWDPHGRSHLQSLVQVLYVPVTGAEIFTIVIALREGMIGAMRRWSWQLLPTAALLLLLVVAIVTAITAPAPEAARWWTSYWLLHLAFGFSIAHLCGRAFGGLDLVAAYLFGCAAFIVAAILFATQVTDPNFDWTSDWPAATHIRHFGYYLAAMIALCLGLAATERRPWVLGLLFIFCTASFAFALWTGSRGTVVGAAGALVLGLGLVRQMRRTAVGIGAVLSLGLGAALAALFPAPGALMGVGRTITQTVGGNISTGRTQIWLNAIAAIRKRPVFGYGADQMATVAPFHGLGQTHNVFLQVLLAWGAVGFLCVVVLAIWFLARSLPAVRREGDLLPPFMVLLALASFATIDGALFHFIPVSIFAACSGMIAAAWHNREKREP